MDDGKGKEKYLFNQFLHKFCFLQFQSKILYLQLYIKYIAYFEFLTGTVDGRYFHTHFLTRLKVNVYVDSNSYNKFTLMKWRVRPTRCNIYDLLLIH